MILTEGARPEDAYEVALEAAEGLVRENDSADARRELGGMYIIDDRFEEAQHQWEVAFRMFRESGRAREAARIALDLASMHISAHGHMAAGSGWLERARMLLDRVGHCVEWGYLELAAMACDRTDVDDLLASANRALEIALEFHDADLEAHALADLGLALVTRGRTSEGLARLDAALAAISTGEVGPWAAGICFCSMLTACDRTGDVRRAQEWARGRLLGSAGGSGLNGDRQVSWRCRAAQNGGRAPTRTSSISTPRSPSRRLLHRGSS